MKKLGKRQRNGLYYLMLAEAEININSIKDGWLDVTRPWGMCSMVVYLTNETQLSLLPEIMEYEPKRKEQGLFWFKIHSTKGWQRRIDIIKKAIKHTT